MAARKRARAVRAWTATTRGSITVAAVVTVVFGVLGPLAPSLAALIAWNASSAASWLPVWLDVALGANGLIFAVVGPWAYYRASRVVRPSTGSWVHDARKLAAAAGMAYGAMSLALLGTAVIGSLTLGLLLGIPLTSHVLLLAVYGPLAVVAALGSVLVTAAEACTQRDWRTTPPGAPAHP